MPVVRTVSGRYRSVSDGPLGVTMLTWAMTRAAAESRLLVEQLQAAGVRAVALPCIERVSLVVPRWQPRSRHHVVLLTSVAAVEAVVDQLRALKRGDVEFAAIGPTTANAVRALGLTVTHETTGGVVALAKVVAASLSDRGLSAQTACWYPTSAAGLDGDEQREAMRVLGGLRSVERVDVYDVVAPRGLGQRLVDQFTKSPAPTAVLFSSPSAVKYFVDAAANRFVTPVLIACWGASTFDEALRHFRVAYLVPRQQPLASSLKALEALTVSSKAFSTSEAHHA